MMRDRKTRLAAAFGVVTMVVALLPGIARADGITTTSGSLTFPNGDPPFFGLSGSGFQASGVITGGGFAGFSDLIACAPNCPAGTAVQMKSLFGGTNVLLGEGTALIHGAAFGNPGVTNISYAGAFAFDAPAINLASGVTSYTVPFTFNGTLIGLETPDLSGPRLFDVALNGTGEATLQMRFDPSTGGPSFSDLSYEFGNIAPTPEPASMLLMGSGLAVMGLSKRLRRRSNR